MSLIVFIDSGTDFSIGLKGGGDIINAIADAFARAFNTVRFFGNDRTERDLRTADAVLDFNTRVLRRVESKEIDQATADHYIRQTEAHVSKLLSRGVTVDSPTPEIPTRQQVLNGLRNQRRLAAGETPAPESSDG